MTEHIIGNVKEGDKAPAVTLPRDGSGEISLSDYAGQNVVLFFYPKDNTSGCTKEAVAFSEHIDAFAQASTAVLGISKDSVKSHDKFRDKHDLRMPLLSDETCQVIAAFGVWVEKSMYGRKYMGTERATFLIDGEGIVRKVWRKVRVPGHVEEVLEAVRAL